MWWIFSSAWAGDEDWPTFFAKFQAAVAARDAAAVAELTVFPFRTWDLFGALPERLAAQYEPGFLELDREQFIEAWPHLFDGRARRRVARANPTEVLDGMGVGIWSGRDWVVWLQFNPNEAGVWRLNGTQNVSE